MIRGKYDKRFNLTDGTEAKSYDSSPGKCIVNEWALLDNMTFWTVGNGTRTRAWHDCWISLGIILKDFLQVNVDDQRNVTIAYIITSNGDWNWNLLRNIFTQDVLDRFISIQPSSTADDDDSCNWSDINNEAFTISNDFKMINNHIVRTYMRQLSNIWNIKALERIRSFTRFVFPNGITTRQFPHHHKIGGPVLC